MKAKQFSIFILDLHYRANFMLQSLSPVSRAIVTGGKRVMESCQCFQLFSPLPGQDMPSGRPQAIYITS